MKRNFLRILKRASTEYWVVLLVCSIWTWYQIENDTSKEGLISTGIKAFSTSFFFLAWLSGQFFRIKKQQFVEDQFSSIKENLDGMFSKIEEQTKDLIGYSTGGDGMGYLEPSYYYQNQVLSLGLTGEGKYPVFDFTGYWVDIDDKASVENGNFFRTNQFVGGTVFPNRIRIEVLKFDLKNQDKLRLNIFCNTRNGAMDQQVRLRKVDGVALIAYQVNSEFLRKSHIPEGFLRTDEKADSIFQ